MNIFFNYQNNFWTLIGLINVIRLRSETIYRFELNKERVVRYH